MSRSTRDYAGKKAKTNKRSKTKKTSKKKATKKNINPLWFVAVTLIATFAIGLAYLSQHEQVIRAKKAVIKTVKAKITKNKPAPKPRFEFYNVLPNQEVSARHRSDSVSSLKSGYELQVASVKQYKEADRLKARLILMGYDVQIKKLKTKRGMFNRISVGPYPSERAAQLAKNELAKRRYKTIIRRIAS